MSEMRNGHEVVEYTLPSGEVVRGKSMQEVLDMIWLSRTPQQILQLKRDIERRTRERARACLRY